MKHNAYGRGAVSAPAVLAAAECRQTLTEMATRAHLSAPARDHSLFIGRGERIESATGVAPLLFFAGTYRVMQMD